MRLSKTKNAIRSAFWGILNKMLVIVFPFIIRTIIIYKLGSEYAGLSSLFTSILKVLNMAELGFSSAVSFSLYKPVADGDTKKICALMLFYRKLYAITGTIVLAIGILFVPFLNNLISGDVPADINLYLLYSIYLIETAISYYVCAYKSVLLSVHQRNDVDSNINSIVHLIIYSLQILTLLIFKSYYIYVFLELCFSVSYNILIARKVSIMYPEYRCSGSISKEEIQDIGKNVYGMFLFKVCAVFRNTLDTVFIAALLGLSAVTVFGNYYYIISAISVMLTILLNAIKGGIGNSIVTKSVEQNYSEMQSFVLLFAWITGICTSCLVCLYQPFMKIWVGQSLMVDNLSMFCFCMYFYMTSAGSIRFLYHQCAGLFWQRRYWTVAEAAMNAVGNYFFLKWWGIKGILISTIFAIFVVDFLYSSRIVFDYYFKNNKINQYYLICIFYFFVTLIGATISFVACEMVPISGWLSIPVRLVICLVITNTLYYAIYSRTTYFGGAKVYALRIRDSFVQRIKQRKEN